MKRFQARRASGRFTRNTMENTFGLHVDVCEACRSFLTHPVGEAAPDVCHRCGAVIVRERCTHGRCEDRFVDPYLARAGGYRECGAPAVACRIDRRWGQCSDHVVPPADDPGSE